MFVDQVKIFIRSGKGGDGHVSFRREIYVPAGGPDGGDGGKGGDLIFEVAKGMNTLNAFRHMKKYCAQDGENGGKRKRHGKNGQDLIIQVPEGTVIKEAETGKVMADLSYHQKRVVLLKGGRGGKGNQHYATPTMQAPKYASPGQPGKQMYVQLELKVIADVGLVGFPNVGKSTFLSRVTNARPKIANYHFTTITPNLGVVELQGGAGFVIADIPGLIEGASKGLGLGHTFLKHIERTRVMIHIVDAASTEGRDPITDIEKIQEELSVYQKTLGEKPQIIAANKMDLLPEEESKIILEKMRKHFEKDGIKVYPISAATGKGIKELLYATYEQLQRIEQKEIIFEREYVEAAEEESQESIIVKKEQEHVFIVEGPKVERMLGYTNLDSEKGFAFFQSFLKETGILHQLEELGIEEGDTVRIYGHIFDYYSS